MPYGEPEWVEIPAGEFWMGSEKGYDDEKPQHKLYLEYYRISKVPVTNTQYHLFTKDAGHQAPEHWEEDRPPKNLESHPVVNVSWYDAMAYCAWLSGKTDKSINLPSEAEWEKAARGDRDKREYPWGNNFEATRCNNYKLGLGTTTPVGIFPDGASPYSCLDMAGNVWEWTRSLWGKDIKYPEFKYPYNPEDGRENLKAPKEIRRVLRGGAFRSSSDYVRGAFRFRGGPGYWHYHRGFRVVVSPLTLNDEASDL